MSKSRKSENPKFCFRGRWVLIKSKECREEKGGGGGRGGAEEGGNIQLISRYYEGYERVISSIRAIGDLRA